MSQFPTPTNGNGGIYLPKWAARSLLGLLATGITAFSSFAVYVSQQTRTELKEYIQERTGDRYTGTDAKRDIQLERERFSAIERRVEKLEPK